jgi:hypothetical protein
MRGAVATLFFPRLLRSPRVRRFLKFHFDTFRSICKNEILRLGAKRNGVRRHQA